MFNAANATTQSAASQPVRRFTRFVRTSLKPVIFKLSRKISVTYWPNRRRTISLVLAAMLSSFVPAFVHAAPTGAQVINGVAKVIKASSTTTLVNQSSQSTIINWQSFSIGAGELVRFNQPNANAVALNRVIGSDPSRIYGSLQANGHVFLVNNAGVYFAPGAQVDVGGLVATSMDISNANFMAGKYTFEAGANAGSVVNEGQLRGSYVVLSAPKVSNAGSITTTGGSTVLAAGARVHMDLDGTQLVSLSVDAATADAEVRNSGSISADGGKVFMTARSANAVLDTVINTSGVVRANTLHNVNGEIVIDGGAAGITAVSGTLQASGETGGSVKVLGDKVALNAGARIDVSGVSGGGQALVGGNFHGAGSERNASMTYVDQNASINADATGAGNGGKVAVWSNQHTTYAGSISARAGARGGDGGFVETSGKQTLAFRGKVDTSAARGKTGTLLLDPNDITISNLAGTIADNGSGTFSSATNSSSIVSVADIITALTTNNVRIDTTSAGGTGNGNISVASALIYNKANSLTLAAEGAITVNAGISNTGSGGLNLWGNGNIGINAPISLAGGALHIAGYAGGASNANTILNANSISTAGGNVTMQASSVIQTGAIDSGSGLINLRANNDVTISGALSTTDASTSAIIINAGANQAAGTSFGGNVTVSGAGSISMGAGGRATLYGGSVAGSSGLTTFIGANSGHFRYNSDESSTNFSAALGAGTYAVYRESPTLTLIGTYVQVYGSLDPTAATVTGLVNGDTLAQALSTQGTLNLATATTSASGLRVAGTTATSVTGGVDQLGYTLVQSAGTLTVTPKTLNMSGLSVPASRAYNGTTSAVVSGSGAFTFEAVGSGNSADGKSYTGDLLSIAGVATGTYNNAHVAGATTVTFGNQTLAGADAANYSFVIQAPVAATITPALLTSTLTNAGITKVYDGTASAPAGFTPTFNIVGFAAGDTAATLSNTGSAYNSAHVLAATQVTTSGLAITGITGSNASVVGDYALAAASNSAAATITPALLTSTLTNAGVTKVYDGTTASGITPTFSLAGLVTGDTAAALTNTSILYDNAHVLGATQVTVAGLAIGSVTGSNASLASDYVLDAASKSVAASITARIITTSLTNAGVTKVYDGSTAAPGGFTPLYSFTNLAAGDTGVTLTDTGSNYDSAHVVGATQVTTGGLAMTGITGSNASVVSDYALGATSTSVAATITPALLTSNLTNTGVTKVYDGTTAAPAGFTPTFNVTGFVRGDTAATLTDTGSSYDSAHVLAATQVTVGGLAVGSITGSNGSVGTDYALASATNSVAASITARLLTSTLSNVGITKTYDGTTAAPAGFTPTFTFTNLAAGDTAATLSDSGTVYDSIHVVGATQVTTSGLALAAITGTNASLTSDYVLDATSKSASASITPALLTSSLTNTGVTKVYDGSASAPAGFTPTFNVTGFVAGDTGVTLTDTGSSYDSAHVVGATQVTVSGLAIGALSGRTASLVSDYALTATSNSVAATITPALLTSNLTNAGVTKVYDGTTAAPAGFTPTFNVTGFINGDTAAALTNTGSSYDSAHVQTATQVTVGGLAVGSITGSNGSVGTDYALASASNSVGASITARLLTSTLSNVGITKTYDGTTAAPAGFTPTFTFSNLAAGDTTATLYDTGTVYDNAHVVGATQVTTSGLSLTSITGANGSQTSDYVLDAASKSASASITPALLTSNLTNAGVTKVYDGTAAAPAGFTPTFNVTGFVAGDTGVTLTDTGSSYDSAHVVGATQVTVSGLAIGALSGRTASLVSDYALTATSNSVAATITPALLTSNLTNAGVTKVYDGTTAAPAGFTPTFNITGLVTGDTAAALTDTGTVYDSAHVVGATQVATGGLAIGSITGSNASVASDYALAAASNSVAATITARMLTSTLSNAGVTKVYDGTTAAPAGFTPTFTFTNLAAGDTAATLSDTGTAYDSAHVVGATQITTSGLAITGITGSNASVTTDYVLDAGSKSVAATITPALLTTNLTNAGVTKVYDGTSAAPAGFTPTFNVTGFVTGDTATTLTNTGSSYDSAHVLAATQVTVGGLAIGAITGTNASVATDYALGAASNSIAATITPALLASTLSNTGVTKTYDGTTAAPAGFTPTYTFTGLVAGDTDAALSNTGAAYDSSHVIGASMVTVSGLAIGGVTGSNASLGSDYVLDAASKNVAATITPAMLTSTLTNAGVTKVYDGTTAAPAGFTPTFNVTGFVAGDTAASITDTGTSYNNAHVVGATMVTTGGLAIGAITGSNASANTDYVLDAASKSVAATITPALLTTNLTNAGVTKVYDGTSAAPAGFTPTFNVTGFVTGDTATTLTNTGSSYDSAHVLAATQVTVGGLAIGAITGTNASVATDYALGAASNSIAATITPALLASTLSNTGVTKTYDGTTAAPAGFTPTYTFTGLVAGDSDAALSNTGAAYDSSHVIGATMVTVSGLAIGGLTGSNASVASDYMLGAASNNVAATITPAMLTSTLTNAGVTKVYDGTTAAPAGFTPTFNVTGFVAGDTAASITDTGSAYNSAHVIGATQVTTSGLAIGAITGSNASVGTDYALAAASNSVAASITPALLTSTLINAGVTKVYDGTMAAQAGFTPTYSFVGLVAGDTTAALTNTSALYDSAHVVGASQVTVGGLAIGSVTGSNASVSSDYMLDATSKSVAASITAATLTSTLTNAGVTKVYDGTTAAPAGFTPTYTFTGLVAGDTTAALTNTGSSYDSAHVVGATQVTVNGLAIGSVTGANASVASDYALTAAANSVAATITPAALTSTLTNAGVTKVYDGTTAAPAGFTPTYNVTGFVAGDTAATLTNTSSAYNNAHVVGATQVTVSGLAVGAITGANASVASDYALTAAANSVAATITPALLTSTLTNAGVTKVYNGTTAAPAGFTPTYSFVGLVAGDTMAALTNTSALYNSAHVVGATQVTVGGLAIGSITGVNASVASDYALDATSKSVAAAITARTITSTLTNTGVTKAYDGTTAAPAGFTPTYSFTNLAAGDTNAALSNTGAAYDSTHVATATKVTVGGLAITGITGSNASVASDYALDATSKNVVATITPLTLTSTLSNAGVTKTYDGTVAAPAGFTPTYTFTGLLAGDTTAALTNTGAQYNSAHVAAATMVTVGGLAIGGVTGANGSLASDYVLDATSKNVAATITPATLIPVLTNTHVVKLFDTTTTPPLGFSPTYSFTGLVAGDTGASLSYTGAAYNSPSAAGATHITVSGLAISAINGSLASLPSDYVLDATSKMVAASIRSARILGGGLVFWSGHPNFSRFDCYLGAPSGHSAPGVCGGRGAHGVDTLIEKKAGAGNKEVLTLPTGTPN
ncbi:MAG: YDG domain-containing protein [Pseudomonadota bacterium]